jgi:hypothetical protein
VSPTAVLERKPVAKSTGSIPEINWDRARARFYKNGEGTPMDFDEGMDILWEELEWGSRCVNSE